MRNGSLFARYEVFVATAILGAHANAGSGRFRQRDVRFIIELFSNWIEHTLSQTVLPLNNTQVLRYLEALVEDGFAKRYSKQSRPSYRLTRPGLLELVTRIVEVPVDSPPEHFFFLYYFISSYRPRILELVEAEGSQFPLSIKLELDSLLDEKSLLEEQIKQIKNILQRLDARIVEAEKGTSLARKLFRQGSSSKEVAEEVSALYPYQLNSQKPLSELFSELPESSGQWELEHGNSIRAQIIWSSSRALYRSYLHQLQNLSQSQGR